MDLSDFTVSRECVSKQSDVPQAIMPPGLNISVSASVVQESGKEETFTYEVQHDTELYVYFHLLKNGEPTSQNFRATLKAMKRHGLPTFERQRFTLTAEQRKRFRFFEEN